MLGCDSVDSCVEYCLALGQHLGSVESTPHHLQYIMLVLQTGVALGVIWGVVVDLYLVLSAKSLEIPCCKFPVII